MDSDSSFKLEFRIIASKCPGLYFSFNKIVDADFINFRDLIDEVAEEYPPMGGDMLSLYYFCMDSNANILVRSDQDVVEMFAKHKALNRCLLSVCYHSPASDPPEVPPWEFGGTGESVQAAFTPSVPCPSIAEPSLETHTQSADTEFLANPNPSNEHVGVDDECLYLEWDPQLPVPPIPHSQAKQRKEDNSESDTCYESDSDDEVEDIDDIVKDREPAPKPDADYDKKDPPMAVGTLYSDMNAFKLALASHATLKEFHYNIEKSDKSRYRVYCSGKKFGCKWRIHAATLTDDVTVQIKKNPYSHEFCQSQRRVGTCFRGPPKKKLKKASTSCTETSIVAATPASRMVFPPNEAVANATYKKRSRKPSSSTGGNTVSSRSVTGSNDPCSLQIEQPPIVQQDIRSCEASLQTVHTPKKKRYAIKKCTPKSYVTWIRLGGSVSRIRYVSDTDTPWILPGYVFSRIPKNQIRIGSDTSIRRVSERETAGGREREEVGRRRVGGRCIRDRGSRAPRHSVGVAERRGWPAADAAASGTRPLRVAERRGWPEGSGEPRRAGGRRIHATRRPKGSGKPRPREPRDATALGRVRGCAVRTGADWGRRRGEWERRSWKGQAVFSG